MIAQTTPDASVTTQTFGAGGLLQAVAVHILGAVPAIAILTHLDENAVSVALHASPAPC